MTIPENEMGDDFDVILPEDLTDKEMDVLAAYLTGHMKNDSMLRVRVLFEKHFCRFISLFAGERLRVPSIKQMRKTIVYCKIYTAVKEGGFTDKAIENAAKKFKKRRCNVERVVTKVRKTITNAEEVLSDE